MYYSSTNGYYNIFFIYMPVLREKQNTLYYMYFKIFKIDWISELKIAIVLKAHISIN